MTFEQCLKKYGVTYFDGSGHHHARTGWIQMDCPFCGRNSNRFHLGYNKRKNYLSCWKCGKHNSVEVIANACDISFGLAKKELDSGDTTQYIKYEEDNRRGKLILPKGLGKLQRQHIRYIEKRGFDPDEIIKLWAIGGIGLESDKYKWRIFIPIRYNHEIVSWTTRSIGKDVTLRYISAPAECEKVNHKEILYGAEYTSKQGACIVEGPIDVWGFGPGGLATCGTGYSRKQFSLLTNYSRVAVWFDDEKEAQKRAMKLINQLTAFGVDCFNITGAGKDAATASTKDINKIRKILGYENK